VKSIVVGTAGHIDHGKTALVKALTGIDADRLQEEKRRGITIDLGFAHLELAAPDGEKIRLGFVDVPGHERFVRNMLAGVGGIDVVLFVIAADESIKPQTREHFDICRLLAVRRGITVLTKADLVDEETLAVARLEVADFLRGSFLDPEQAPVVAVSSKTGAGVEELKRELARVAAEVPAKDSSAYFRLPVDRVFTMKGFGTVITGTLVAGSVNKESEVEIFPQRQRARVRGVEVHGQPAEIAMAGQRTALNLAGPDISTHSLARGMTLAAAGVFEPTRRADVSLTLLPGARPLRDRARVHMHAFTDETVAEVVLHGGKEIRPGESAFAQLRVANPHPMLLLPGDRFILRQFSPVVTIGGGVVLDSAPLKAKTPALNAFLTILATGNPSEVLAARIARRTTEGLSLQQAIAETGWSRAQIESVASELEKPGGIIKEGEIWINAAMIEGLKLYFMSELARFHQRNPLVSGIGREELREKLEAPPAAYNAALNSLLKEKKVELSGEQVRAAGRSIVMKEDEAESKLVIEQAFRGAGLKVPALKEVLAGLKLDPARAQRIVTLLLREKVLIKVSEELVFHRDSLQSLREAVAGYKIKASKIDVAGFKDLAGVTRKYAIPLLEYLDRERITRRVGDERVIN
jgi:selenocysteine-specific elongation factor